MEQSKPAYAQLAAALAKAQAEITHASKDRTNPHFGQGYASLAAVWDAVRGPLTKHGLSVVQTPEVVENGTMVQVDTLLLHASGEFLRGTLRMPVAQKTAQGVGSAISYARRYALSAMVGVAPDDDDDGNEASRQPPRRAPAVNSSKNSESSRTAKEEKEPAKPAESPRAQLSARMKLLWSRAVASGIDGEQFSAWARKTLGRLPQSELKTETLTVYEVDQLEKAFPSLIRNDTADAEPEIRGH